MSISQSTEFIFRIVKQFMDLYAKSVVLEVVYVQW